MRITEHGVILQLLEPGAAVIRSGCNQINHCNIVDVFPSPQLFYLSQMKMPYLPKMTKMTKIIAQRDLVSRHSSGRYWHPDCGCYYRSPFILIEDLFCTQDA
ncbi:hypothetical protein [Kosakonia arachidis]|nr:hypothetical protein [Kosakonia arachidis]